MHRCSSSCCCRCCWRRGVALKLLQLLMHAVLALVTPAASAWQARGAGDTHGQWGWGRMMHYTCILHACMHACCTRAKSSNHIAAVHVHMHACFHALHCMAAPSCAEWRLVVSALRLKPKATSATDTSVYSAAAASISALKPCTRLTPLPESAPRPCRAWSEERRAPRLVIALH